MTDAAITEVQELEERRWAAMIAKDTDTLADLFADEMCYTHSNGVAEDKASYLKSIAERIFDYKSVERSDQQASRVGDTVLLTGRAEFDVVAGGREVHLNVRHTVVWVRKDGRWQFLCWQSTALPA
jgi:ketosteroid isomerase-like protein